MGNLLWTSLFLMSLCSSSLLLVISLFSHSKIRNKPRKFKGTVVVRLNNELERSSRSGSTSDEFRSYMFLSLSADIRLISSTNADSSGNGKLGKPARVDGVFNDNHPPMKNNEYEFTTYFDYDKNFGTPGAFYIKNLFSTEFFLVSLTLEDIHNLENINFSCNSWISNDQTNRIFFANNTYLPSETPPPLVNYRQLELEALRGDGTGERKKGERIYDYDVYNDLGDPDKDESLARLVAGGSIPYPRRGRTGRKPTIKDSKTESKSQYVYVPRDEEVIDFPLKGDPIPEEDDKEFDSFNNVLGLYVDGGGKLPKPQVIEANEDAWRDDDEFAREVLAGVNPGLIRCVQEKDLKTEDKKQLAILGLLEEIQEKKLFVLDHHDPIMRYLKKINSTSSRVYASKTYFQLTDEGTLTPIQIVLSLPHDEGDESVVLSKTYRPVAKGNIEGYKWQLAKAYVIVNDTCYHQLISHWLHTHAVVEPFVIATNRQLSVVHPIYKLLHPHFRNTMNINAAARKGLVNADGVIESAYAWGKYGVEMSSVMYKDWVFPDQALPRDLIKRGMAIEDPSSPHGIRLVIKDYPYAVDGLDIWSAINTWVQEYVSLYYTSDEIVQQDPELQSWWKEIIEVGHGDKKDEKWWSKMQTRKELIQACTIIIWIASALHAAVNFGQYPYGGFILNRPTTSRQFMPKKGTPEYDELKENFERAYLKTITNLPKTSKVIGVLSLLSSHSPDEYYLGQKEDAKYWTFDTKALEAFGKFGKTLAEIENKITERNKDHTLKNRVGEVKMPYTLLYPSSEKGITLRGIPNSISI